MQDFWKVAMSFWSPWEPDGIKGEDPDLEVDEMSEWEEEDEAHPVELDPEERFEVWGFEL